ncbi:MarR family winged helix-turn-helix transcriptional regulator [Levilactobacillus yonginensis]|uniref:MarR family winged helix-turn-helix transcriptional regulator n=1 Tax=Levilactobacillus yonginensis TaxID=1054041 RepID=UPI0013DE2EFA|nr:MarR family winged helix-turn-helix transcriptional regulator [Levilactobacillus yonginensis]
MNSQDIHHIREFDRFYTRIFRLTDKYHLQTTLTLLEARLLLEIAENGYNTANQLVQVLRVDKGYLSRILKRLEERGLLAQTPAELDKRSKILSLTDAGNEQLAIINQRSDDQVRSLFTNLTSSETKQVISAMQFIEEHVTKIKE